MRRLVPSPSMVVAVLALLVALSGSAYAVSKVGTSQIKNGAITTPKLKKGAVTSAKIRNGSVIAAKFADGAVPRGAANNVRPLDPLALTENPQTLVSKGIRVRAGQTLVASGVVSLFQFFSGSAEVSCQIQATRPDGENYAVSPQVVSDFDTSGQIEHLPLMGNFEPDRTGEWIVVLLCDQPDGDATILVGQRAVQAFALAP